MGTKKFQPEDFEGFLNLLPRELSGRPLRHAIEVRNETFKSERFYDLARKYNVAIIFADDDEFPAIEEPTADFTYARLMRTEEDVETGYTPKELDGWAKRAKAWAKRGDAFVYFISGAKVRAPAAAEALIKRVA
jgi:uncharacterized protein YecE (DUF72 family)